MDAFRFDHKLFQRGQTWRECMESWKYRRDLFLERALQDFSLPKSEKVLASMTDRRIVVLYDPKMLDAMKTVPILGNVLSRIPSLELRLFSQDIFFPVLYQPFGRHSPRLLLLEAEGRVEELWGPRPEAITRQLQDISVENGHGERDRLLWDYQDLEFCALLDDSLARLFTTVNGIKK